MGSDAKPYMRKGFLMYEEKIKYFTIYEEAVSTPVRSLWISLYSIWRKFSIFLSVYRKTEIMDGDDNALKVLDLAENNFIR